MLILGISAYYHDSAISVIRNGTIDFAVQEERFSRIKNDSSFPANAIEYYLSSRQCKLKDFDRIVFYEDPKKKRQRQFWSMCHVAPFGFSAFRRFLTDTLTQSFSVREQLINDLALFDEPNRTDPKLSFVSHHDSHAASAFYPSPYDDALVITIDGVGEWDTTTISRGSGNTLTRLESHSFPDSLGLLYSTFTSYLGFKINNGEYKMMGLAPFGQPKFADQILAEILDLTDDGFFKMNPNYFSFLKSDRMFSDDLCRLLGGEARKPDQEFSEFHADVACSIQSVIETAIEHVIGSAVARHDCRTVCYAGGVALNCVANGKLLAKGCVDNLWIQPAAGDAGGSLGAALLEFHNQPRNGPPHIEMTDMNYSRLGPSYSETEIERTLNQMGIVATKLKESELATVVAGDLASGAIVGWYQGRSEFGPRALGGRSILADPRQTSMQSRLNLAVKMRESFRPFAPIVLEEAVGDWFKNGFSSPYMLLVDELKDDRKLVPPFANEGSSLVARVQQRRSKVPAVTHVDYSARLQTVTAQSDERMHSLLTEFQNITGVPMLINTSFNVNEEPIVNSPKDAILCFISTKIDILVMDCFVIKKSEQNIDALVRMTAGKLSSQNISTEENEKDIYSLN